MSSSDPNIQTAHNSDTTILINNHSLPIVLILLLLIFFFFGFLTVYFCRCVMDYLIGESGVLRRNHHTIDNVVTQRNVSMHGLDPSILLTFPTFEYSKVKDLRQEKGTLECAVCISEFQDDDMLRLLTVCNHAFHPECVDLWLSSHTTCPVCRRDLLDPAASSPDRSHEVSVDIPPAAPMEEDGLRDHNSSTTQRVSFKEDDTMRRDRNLDGSMSAYVECSGEHVAERFSRSHSTGHSILHGDYERYTLRLPENVKKRFLRGHNLTESCTTFGDFSGDITIEKNGLAEASHFTAVAVH